MTEKLSWFNNLDYGDRQALSEEMPHLKYSALDQLFQVENDVVWDGDLISKSDRDAHIERRWMFRMNGYNGITSKGRKVISLIKKTHENLKQSGKE